MSEFLLTLAVKTVLIVSVCMLMVAYLTLAERKILGFIQLRYGPNRVGFWGLLQPIADGIKAFLKEEVTPDNADRKVFLVAPIISIAAPMLLLVVIPFGDTVTLFGREYTLYLSNPDIGILFVLGISTLGSYGGMLGGWASGNKYGYIGGVRSTAMMVSYELSMAFAVICVILLSNSLSLVEIVHSQAGVWNIFKAPVAFVIFIISGLAELNRTPFDMPEAEAELCCGYNVEYSSMKFALFFFGEYTHLFVFGCLVTTLFLGGWHGPVLPGVIWFFIKTFAVIFFCIWQRATFPRLRWDFVMKLEWKFLLPVAIANVLVTGFVLAIF
ncbi:MAG: NADH-quinone oxidoreductase subunit NuoH [Desulfohalobiaceae bacterium]|nr:NADH-quinone oxidoreductase subunit NuoH [Desulfohalobiaceae bacterium]